jgi:hypothetical protein
MNARMTFAVAALTVAFAGAVQAQDFGVMESAETINRGNFKLGANPVLVLGEDDFDNEFGVAVRAGYGFTDRLDVEAKAAFYDGLTFIGADLEYWIVKGGDLDLSVTVGGHLGMGSDDAFDSKGLDLTAVASTKIAEKLEIYGALDIALESIDDVPAGFDDSFTTLHIVPGIEYKISEDLDFVAEFGLGLNDDASHYLSGGLSYYLR